MSSERNGDRQRSDLPAADDPRRVAVRAWIADHPDPSPTDLADAGYSAPHWPEPWGLDADAEHQVIIGQELHAAGIGPVDNQIGIGWAGPTILFAGTAEQKARYLRPMLTCDEFWCQLFSEPEAGSDLSSLGTRAVLDGDEWVVNGQKVWSTWADKSAFGILLARTDPAAPKHRGISYFICPMDQPGIDIRPIREMSGGHHFNEVFFDDARIPAANLVGTPGDGWRLARVTLGNERVSLSHGGVCWGMGPTSDDFFDALRSGGGTTDPVLRQRAAAMSTEAFLLQLHDRKILGQTLAGTEPGPEASLKKLMADEHGQRITDLAADLCGTEGLLAGDQRSGEFGGGDHEQWPWAQLFARALTIGGGTTQVQRNILAERVLGLPRDEDPTASRPWSTR